MSLALSFKYFESEQGLRFLLETGQLDPESKSTLDLDAIAEKKMPQLELTQKMRSVWNPRLLDEAEDEYLDSEQLFAKSSAEFESGLVYLL